MSSDATSAASPEHASRNPFANRDYRAWLTATVVTALGVGIQIAVVPLFSSGLMTLRPLPRRGLLVALTPVLAAVPLVVFGLSERPWLTVVALLAIGPPAAIFMNLSLALLQEHTPQAVMGRVMGVYSLMFAASMPIGIAQTGLLTTLWGPQVCIVASSIAGGVAGILLLVWSPVRKLT